MTAPPLPPCLDVECPHCWASIGERCYVLTGRRDKFTRKPHAVRIRESRRVAGGRK